MCVCVSLSLSLSLRTHTLTHTHTLNGFTFSCSVCVYFYVQPLGYTSCYFYTENTFYMCSTRARSLAHVLSLYLSSIEAGLYLSSVEADLELSPIVDIPRTRALLYLEISCPAACRTGMHMMPSVSDRTSTNTSLQDASSISRLLTSACAFRVPTVSDACKKTKNIDIIIWLFLSMPYSSTFPV